MNFLLYHLQDAAKDEFFVWFLTAPDIGIELVNPLFFKFILEALKLEVSNVGFL